MYGYLLFIVERWEKLNDLNKNSVIEKFDSAELCKSICLQQLCCQ